MPDQACPWLDQEGAWCKRSLWAAKGLSDKWVSNNLTYFKSGCFDHAFPCGKSFSGLKVMPDISWTSWPFSKGTLINSVFYNQQSVKLLAQEQSKIRHPGRSEAKSRNLSPLIWMADQAFPWLDQGDRHGVQVALGYLIN